MNEANCQIPYRIISSYIRAIENVSTSGGSHYPGIMQKLTLQLLLCQIVLVFIKVEESLWDRLGRRFVLWVVVWFEVWMSEGLLHVDPLDGVERKQLLEQV